MAEQVHLHQESSLQGLARLLEQGIFSEKRIKDILVTREKFEYRLKRRGVLKDDYIKYIEYEKQLDVEIRETVASDGHLNAKYLYFQQVLKLYQRAVAKFSHDVCLWLEFLEYSSVHATRVSFMKSLNRALKLHPRCFRFWLLAANWEWNRNGNMIAARKLFQQGIQVNPMEPQLYLALFKLEVSFCEKVLERRAILGATSAPEEGHVLGGELAKIVLQGAAEVEGGITAQEAAEYLACALQTSGFLPNLLPQVLSLIKRLLVNNQIDRNSLGRCILSYPKEAIRTQLTLAFLEHLQDDLDEKLVFFFADTLLKNSVSAPPEVTQMIYSRVNQLLQLAEDKKLVSPDCYLLWLKSAGILGYDNERTKSLVERALWSNPNDQRLLFQVGILNIQNIQTSQHLTELSRLMERLEDPNLKKELLSLLLNELSAHNFVDSEEIGAFIKKILVDPAFPLDTCSTCVFGKICSTFGVGYFRRLCNELCQCRVVCASFYEAWITIEIEQRGCDPVKCRSLIVKAQVLFPSHAGILRAAYYFERSLNNFAQAAKYAECAKTCGVQI